MTSANTPSSAAPADEDRIDESVGESADERLDESADERAETRLQSDDVFSILANDRRREAIKVLCGVEDAIDLSELAERVAAAQRDVPVEDLGDDAVQNMYISMYQTHVPVLEEAGVVVYDSDHGVVEPTDAIAVFERHLVESSTVDEDRDRWIDYYVLGGVVSVALWAVHALAIVKGYGLVLHSTSVLSMLAVVAGDVLQRVRAAMATPDPVN